MLTSRVLPLNANREHLVDEGAVGTPNFKRLATLEDGKLIAIKKFAKRVLGDHAIAVLIVDETRSRGTGRSPPEVGDSSWSHWPTAVIRRREGRGPSLDDFVNSLRVLDSDEGFRSVDRMRGSPCSLLPGVGRKCRDNSSHRRQLVGSGSDHAGGPHVAWGDRIGWGVRNLRLTRCRRTGAPGRGRVAPAAGLARG